MNSHEHDVAAARARRLELLTAPGGWLSLVGFEWLQEGANRIGSASDNDVVLQVGPAHLGTIVLAADGTSTIELVPGSGAVVDGQAVERASLRDDARGGTPSEVRFGSATLIVIERDGRKAVRVKDEQAETRVGFEGLEYFPIDPTWRVVADWVPFDPPYELELGTVIGTIEKENVPGKAVFTRDGRVFELYPIQEVPEALFFVFGDLTSGKETYGAGRFLDTGLPVDGKLVIDFNEARNPPCAFTPYATCQLAPPENRLDVRVEAGELKYRGGH
ncbi:DUF1684 domain-containing protein [Luteibacter sp. SG786]|uniref:DUF1684 domain-containing protein n=1 Tax=Luteibacter sp. SG786 TaxID=2587130 RepID=UPI001ABB35B7|nr:DUF1684 domain-containing protein [Luteibacter sp. SG786]NII52999.1 hypothetical protein [Luteibacter sp. SG786]